MNKRLTATILLLTIAVTLAGCSEKETPVSNTQHENETYDRTLEYNDSNSYDSVVGGNAYYDDCFKDFFYDTDLVGAPMEYEDVMTMISDPDNGGVDSYYLMEVRKALTLSECEEIDGWFDMFSDYYEGTTETGLDANEDTVYFDNNTVYEVNIIKNLINDTAMNETVYLLMKTGNPYTQVKGDPIYAPGEMLCAALKNTQPNCELRQTTGDFMLRFDVIASDFGDYWAKTRFKESELFPIGEEINETRVTSTTANPVTYRKRVLLDELSDFLRSDWGAELSEISASGSTVDRAALMTEYFYGSWAREGSDEPLVLNDSSYYHPWFGVTDFTVSGDVIKLEFNTNGFFYGLSISKNTPDRLIFTVIDDGFGNSGSCQYIRTGTAESTDIIGGMGMYRLSQKYGIPYETLWLGDFIDDEGTLWTADGLLLGSEEADRLELTALCYKEIPALPDDEHITVKYVIENRGGEWVRTESVGTFQM